RLLDNSTRGNLSRSKSPSVRTHRATYATIAVERAMEGVWTGLKLAFAAFFTILFKGTLPAPLQHGATTAPAPTVSVVADTVDRAVQLLALLQRDGRLVDFLMEDVAAYSDTQIGTAVRDVH